ncbi:MAG: hypothetical protein H7061_00765 [Bdellovibrionaceae bacterium]|nr:hypothetical protein [Bdellovibrio sp.]
MQKKTNFFLKIILFAFLLGGITFYFWNKLNKTLTVAAEESPDKNIQQILPRVPEPLSHVSNKPNGSQSIITTNVDSDGQFKFKSALKNAHKNQRSPSAQFRPSAASLNESPYLDSARWKIWKNVKAISAEALTGDEVIVGEVNHLFLIQHPPAQVTNLAQFDRDEPVVVYDGRLRKAGLISGVIKIETSNRAMLESDLGKLQAKVFDAFDNIETYFVSSQNNRFNLEELFKFLKSRPYVKSAELEIIGTTYEKN